MKYDETMTVHAGGCRCTQVQAFQAADAPGYATELCEWDNQSRIVGSGCSRIALFSVGEMPYCEAHAIEVLGTHLSRHIAAQISANAREGNFAALFSVWP